MEGIFPRNVSLNIIILKNSFEQGTIEKIKFSLVQNGPDIRNRAGCKSFATLKTPSEFVNAESNTNTNTNTNTSVKFIDFVKCLLAVFPRLDALTPRFANISMLKRSRSMEFDSDQAKTSSGPHHVLPLVPSSSSSSSLANSKDENDDDSDSPAQITKKMCDSSSFDEGKSPAESDESPDSNRSSSHGRPELYRRYSQTGENAYVTQSRSIFSHKDSFVYGNPKEDIRGIENQGGGDAAKGESSSSFEASSSSNVLDLSCKPVKTNVHKTETEGTTYQTTFQRGNRHVGETPTPRSNPDIKIANLTNSKKPSFPEQLQIAKIQQQQRRSMQQQQKFLQQMRKSLDPKSTGNRQDSSHKNVKHFGNSTTNHEPPSDLDNHQRAKDDFLPRFPGIPFPHLPYPYFDPNHPKELPDNHPILPLLDPVYFSALYNAHGFLPPSSPSIAAAFIGTLQDALPKLPMMFPSTSANNPSLLPQKSNENPH